ncbi:MAG: hypothetical protein AB7H97_21945, partial [Pseudobdellovibrionaceae bacterium]
EQAEKAKFWRVQMAAFGAYRGSQQQFCKERNLSPHVFQYWKKKCSKEVGKDVRPAMMVQPSPFVAVQIERQFEKLPDAKWLAQLIHYLQREI